MDDGGHLFGWRDSWSGLVKIAWMNFIVSCTVSALKLGSEINQGDSS